MASATDWRHLPSGRHGLPRKVIVQSQRERLLAAMLDVASEKGYEATTVADVIESAGVSRTTFYELFEDKEQCFLASYDAVADILVSHATHAYRENGGTWPQRIHAGLAAMLELLADKADIARLAMVEATAAGPTARQRFRDTLTRFTPFLDEGRAMSSHSSQLPVTTSRLAIGGAATLIVDEVRADRAGQLGEILPDVVFCVLMPFIGPEAAAAEMRRPPTNPDQQSVTCPQPD